MTRSPLALALVLMACARSTTLDQDSGAPDATLGAMDGGPRPESDAPAPTDTSMPCNYVLDSTCATDADCLYGVHHQAPQCCQVWYIGFRATEQATYTADEAACYDTVPDCGCLTYGWTDSGEQVSPGTPLPTVHVGCIQRPGGGVCLTYVAMRPPDSM